ncbi:protein disulfide-isomerase [Purpureocillium lavendulum]|uniref:Protein disulfide-isomerase n=1 Tax=Purpureocillium lavendulum TaxID=1247861 RepID=A0AB34FSM3_9HYPO|nr:protein disulfide-isomerase [Purpureocillium lavendulum]
MTLQRHHGRLVTVDCSVSHEACVEHDVTSFPAIRLYRRGEATMRYRGPRRASACVQFLSISPRIKRENADTASIASFLGRIQRPIVSHLTNESLDEFASSDSVVFVAHLGRDGDSVASRVSCLAGVYRDRYTFGAVQGRPSDPSTLQCHNNEDGTLHRCAKLDSPGAFEALLATCAEPLIPQMSRRNELKYIQAGTRSLVYYMSDDVGEREAYVAALRPVAKRFHEYLQFVTVDSSEFPAMSHALGVASNGGLAVQNLHTGQVYPFRAREESSAGSGAAARRGMPTAEAVEDFITAISRGQVEPWNGRYKDGDESTTGDGTGDGHGGDGGAASRHDEL